MNLYYYATELGRVGIGEHDGRITTLSFTGELLPEQAEICETAVLQEAARQLQAYLAGERRCFSLVLAPAGTPFMHLGGMPLRSQIRSV